MTRVGKRKNLTLFGGYFVPTLDMTGLRVNFVECYSGTLYQFKSKKSVNLFMIIYSCLNTKTDFTRLETHSKHF